MGQKTEDLRNFHCSYECNRDVVGALNVGRKYLSGSKMEQANPVEYISTGNHASFPSHADECARFTGVQSTAIKQDLASSRQTQLPQFRSTPLAVKRGEVDTGGLHQNYSSNTASRQASGSIVSHVLASATGSLQTLPNTTEN